MKKDIAKKNIIAKEMKIEDLEKINLIEMDFNEVDFTDARFVLNFVDANNIMSSGIQFHKEATKKLLKNLVKMPNRAETINYFQIIKTVNSLEKFFNKSLIDFTRDELIALLKAQNIYFERLLKYFQNAIRMYFEYIFEEFDSLPVIKKEKQRFVSQIKSIKFEECATIFPLCGFDEISVMFQNLYDFDDVETATNAKIASYLYFMGLTNVTNLSKDQIDIESNCIHTLEKDFFAPAFVIKEIYEFANAIEMKIPIVKNNGEVVLEKLPFLQSNRIFRHLAKPMGSQNIINWQESYFERAYRAFLKKLLQTKRTYSYKDVNKYGTYYRLYNRERKGLVNVPDSVSIFIRMRSLEESREIINGKIKLFNSLFESERKVDDKKMIKKGAISTSFTINLRESFRIELNQYHFFKKYQQNKTGKQID